MMANDVLITLSRQERRAVLAKERKVRQSGHWGPWEWFDTPTGVQGARNGGWLSQVRRMGRCGVFSVLCRPLHGALHCMVTSLSGNRPTWWEMQRIKNEVAGEAAQAVEIYPPQSEVVDDADMYHIWILKEPLPFTLK